jgi:hypothetical protein
VHTTFLNNSFSCNCWETFTLRGASSSFSYSTGAIGRFEGVIASSAIIESSPASTKTKGVAGII